MKNSETHKQAELAAFLKFEGTPSKPRSAAVPAFFRTWDTSSHGLLNRRAIAGRPFPGPDSIGKGQSDPKTGASRLRN